MAIIVIKRKSQLGEKLILSPERYDPRREALNMGVASVPLRDLAFSVRKVVNASSSDIDKCIVLDTSDAKEGVITARKSAIKTNEIGSTKKLLQENDIIISRLRPYLRQVALVDKQIQNWKADIKLVCSSEFFVLRSIDNKSIAFLVPFLLSGPVQKVLEASQEGGHHPRFNESTLLDLPVPRTLQKKRDEVSEQVELTIKKYREFESRLLAFDQSF